MAGRQRDSSGAGDREAGDDEAVPAYAFILGELARRVTRTPLPETYAGEFFRPLGLDDVHLGLPAAQWPRHVKIP
jgi:hypothetical protein